MVQKIITELTDVIGVAASFEIVKRWSGRELYVPERMTEHHPIALTIGFDRAQQLSKEFGGSRLRMTIERNALRHIRDERIFHEKEVMGRSYSSVADEFGLSRHAVMAIVKKMQVVKDAA